MSERDVIDKTRVPATVTSLTHDLLELGIRPDMVLLVHSSLSALGWVCGGAVAVIQALVETVGSEGTLVMPTFSTDLTDPENWQNPPVPEDWKDTIRAEMPAFDSQRTPTREMGRIAETFRTWPGVLRSMHPHCSFSAWGKHARRIVEGHHLDNALGEGSPLARIYELDGHVLLLGVGHANNSSLHLAEYRATYPGKHDEINGAPMLVDGKRQWVDVRDLVLDIEDFVQIGEAFAAATQAVQEGSVGAGKALLMPQRPLVDFAVEWMETHRREGKIDDAA